MVRPLVEALLLPVLRRRAAAAAPPLAPTRLVGAPQPVDSIGFVAEGTTVLLLRPSGPVEVVGAGGVVLPPLLGRTGATCVVLTHDPVDVWLRAGPFETLEGRVVQQVELGLTVSLDDSPAGLADLAEQAGATGPAGAGGLADAVLARLAREVSDRTTQAVRRRTLAELTGTSLAVLLDEALPARFLGGVLVRSALEVVDVDWPTEGRGWRPALVPAGDGPAVTTR